MSQQEALNLALAQARTEIDAGVEAARLAAAQREALEAMIATLETERDDSAATNATLTAELDTAREALSAEEAARLAAAAAETLRARLEYADAELTAMTLALEQQRQDAEDTLTLLAAARAAEADPTTRLSEALLAQEAIQRIADSAMADIADLEARMAAELLAAQRQSALWNKPD